MDAPGCYRCLFPGRQLQEKGGHDVILPKHDMVMAEDGTKTRYRFKVDFDPPDPMAHLYVLQSRLERMWGEDGAQRLRTWGVMTVADVDDNYEELPYWNPAFYGTHPYRRDDGVIVNREERRRVAKKLGWKKMPPNASNRDHLHRTFGVVDAMTVSTPYLKDLYSKYNANITVVRNYVDWDIWKDIQPQYEVKRWQDRIRIGYLGVFRYRRGDLEVLKDVVSPFLLRHPNVDFVANSKEVHDFLNVPQRQRVTVKEYHFSPVGGGEYPLGRKTAVLDIGLVPLTPGGLAEGKSHLKGMEYNAAGIPFIASDTESYRYWTEMGMNGYIADTTNEWIDLLEHLVTEDESRRAMGYHGRKKAEEHSIQNNWFAWNDVYEGLQGGKYEALARGAIARGAVQKVSELANLLKLADGEPIKNMVEVGSARGGTFWAFAQLAQDDALVASVDIPAGSPLDVRGGVDVYTGRDRERFRRFAKETQRVKLIDANSQLQSTVDKLLDTLGSEKIDVLFIDADHRYEGVKRDFELYSPLVREGGLIAFHDVIVQNDTRSGVHILWRELRQRYAESHEWVGTDAWGLGNWGGIGAVRV